MPEKVDLVVSINAFEHFSDALNILIKMSETLNPDGEAWIAFGPLWRHPYGGHDFSPFPWAHLLFTEKTLINWRSRYIDDSAARFEEIRGGSNKMTIDGFLRLIEKSPFKKVSFSAVPINKLRLFHCKITRELFTSIVKYRLALKNPMPPTTVGL